MPGLGCDLWDSTCILCEFRVNCGGRLGKFRVNMVGD